MKLKHNIIYLAVTALSIISCGKQEKETENADVKTEQSEKGHDGEPQNIASLTEEQMKSVGVAWGTVELK